MTFERVFMASALLVSTSLLAGCGDYSLLSASTPGVYKGRPDVHQAVDPEQHRNALRKRVWATQGTVGMPRGL